MCLPALRFSLSLFHVYSPYFLSFRSCTTLLDWIGLNWLFNVTINDISVIYVTAHMCAGGLKKKLYLRSGSQRHRHFAGFFNVPVLAPTRDQPFYTVHYLVHFSFVWTIELWLSRRRRLYDGSCSKILRSDKDFIFFPFACYSPFSQHLDLAFLPDRRTQPNLANVTICFEILFLTRKKCMYWICMTSSLGGCWSLVSIRRIIFQFQMFVFFIAQLLRAGDWEGWAR